MMSNIPEGYKQTEVGVIPEEWEVKKLGDISEIIMGQSPAGNSYNQNANGIALINGPTEFTEKYPIKIQWTTLPTKLCKEGDILLCIRGSSTGRMNISNESYCIGRGVAAIRAKVNSDGSFLEFQVQNAVKKILVLTTGSTFPNIDGKSLKNIEIAVPPLPEQQAIASALSDVDALITALEQLINKKRDIKQGAMQQLLTGKKRLPGFSGEWEIKKLGEIADVKTGPFGSSLHERDYVVDGTPIITVEHLGERGVVHENLPMVSDFDKNRLNAYALQADDIVFSRVGSVDRNSLIKEKENGWLFSGRLLRIRLNTKYIFPAYLSYYFHQEPTKQRIRSVAVGQTMASLNTEILKNIEVAFPPTVKEQIAIAHILRDMDTEIEALEQKRDKYRALKQGMMQELLTGKTRLV
ncbi:restriction endonuclease subunit S [Candidatus Methanoperedens nitratireducens]|uniref:HsdS n=1 Tax=Candidatus Methanoperedens nitratireducens TaxID=1392998 RepID=A0A284VLI2_9EURY|nr:restriction endonuclease subunit S [Candidatus Methanoperedens nitroreducens]SNQ60069.1 HsdS [Candidatus Methanoperedens nitroreducens]